MSSTVLVGACAGGNRPSGFDETPDGGSSGGGSSGSGSSSSGDNGGSSSGTPGSGSSSGSLVGDGAAPEAGPTSGEPTTCAEAAAAHSYVGCDYWPTITANNVWSIFDFAAVVANAGNDQAEVTVTGPAGTNVKTSVPAHQLATVYLPWVKPLKGADTDECGTATALSASVLARGAAFHLVSTVPVTVYQFNALEYQGKGGASGKDWSSCPGNQVCQQYGVSVGCYSFSNDASLLLPSTAMTGNYRIAGHGGWGAASLGALATITATADNTTVNVKVSGTGQVAAGGGIAAASAGGTVTLQMNAGDVAELVGGTADGSDLSGSLVQAVDANGKSAPVQVITSMPCVDVPDNASACDHVEEVNFPAETLGTDYVVVQPPAPDGHPAGHEVRIVGNFDGTHLTYVPAAPPGCPTTINAGQVVDCGSTLGKVCQDPNTGAYNFDCGAGNIVSTDFEIKGDQAFAVETFTEGASLVDPKTQAPNQQGDPDESMAVAVAQYRTKYVFLTPADYTQSYATVIVPSGTSVSIDASNVATPPSALGSSGFGVLRVKLGPGQGGAHVLEASNPVGLEVTGYGAYTSYTYPGGLDLKVISPPPPAN